MLENYMIYAKDVMNFLTERGYRSGYTGIVDDVIDKSIVHFYFKEKSVFKLIVNNLFMEEIVNCNSENQLSSGKYPQGALLTKLDAGVQAVPNGLRTASILFTFNNVNITGIVFCWNGYDLFPCVDNDGVSDVTKMEII